MITRRIRAGGINHRVRVDGDSGPWVVFSNSLGCTLEMWDEQVAALTGQCRTMRYDTRGHGDTASTPPPYDFELLSGDLLELMDALRIASATFVGLSMGGMLGQVAAIRAPERFDALLFADTTSFYGPEKVAFWSERARMAVSGQLDEIAESTPQRWFTPSFVAQRHATVQQFQQMLLLTSPRGYAGCCAAISRINVTDQLRDITAPTSVVVGEHDPSTTVDHAQRLHAAIPHSTLRVIPNAAHMSNVEQPEAFNRALLDLLEEAS